MTEAKETELYLELGELTSIMYERQLTHADFVSCMSRCFELMMVLNGDDRILVAI